MKAWKGLLLGRVSSCKTAHKYCDRRQTLPCDAGGCVEMGPHHLTWQGARQDTLSSPYLPSASVFPPQMSRAQDKWCLKGGYGGMKHSSFHRAGVGGVGLHTLLRTCCTLLSQAAVGVTSFKYKVVSCIKQKYGCHLARFSQKGRVLWRQAWEGQLFT